MIEIAKIFNVPLSLLMDTVPMSDEDLDTLFALQKMMTEGDSELLPAVRKLVAEYGQNSRRR